MSEATCSLTLTLLIESVQMTNDAIIARHDQIRLRSRDGVLHANVRCRSSIVIEGAVRRIHPMNWMADRSERINKKTTFSKRDRQTRNVRPQHAVD